MAIVVLLIIWLASSMVWKSKRIEISQNLAYFSGLIWRISYFASYYDEFYNMKSKYYLFRILSTLAWCLDGRPCYHLVQPLLGLQHGLEVQKNWNPVKIWLISSNEYDDFCRSIYYMKSKSYLFRILLTPAWSLELGPSCHHLVQPLLGLQDGLEVQKNWNPVKIWLISSNEYDDFCHSIYNMNSFPEFFWLIIKAWLDNIIQWLEGLDNIKKSI